MIAFGRSTTWPRQEGGRDGPRPPPHRGPDPTVRGRSAVANYSVTKTETDYIVDGMTEVLIAELAKNRARVVSWTL